MRNTVLFFLVSACAPLVAQNAPSISAGGIVNAASYMDGANSGSGIARGSIFSIFGDGLGPATPVEAAVYPLPAQLGGTSVKVVQGANSMDAIIMYASPSQVNAILPSKAAAGPAQVVVTYNGAASQPASITVVDSNFGIFSLAAGAGPGVIQNFNSDTDQPLNSLANAAKPGQYIMIWGTGLGPVSNDAVAATAGDLPAQVQVSIGGKPATKLYSGRSNCCAGLDEIVVQVPADSPATCYVPVQIRTGNAVYSNVVTMSVHPQGGQCSDSSPFTPLLLSGGKSGWLQTLRANVSAQLGAASMTLTADLGLAFFRKLGVSGEHAFDILFSMPSIGTCLTYAANLSFASTGGMTKLLGLTSADALDPGNLSISGTKGTIALGAASDSPGTYMGVLGGVNPSSLTDSTPLFLDPGTFTFSGAGGKDIGPFQTTFAIPDSAVWTNRDQIDSVDRSQGVTLTWTPGANAGSQLAFIGGLSSGSGLTDTAGSATGLFFCLAPMEAGSFTIPASALANLPASSGDLTSSIAGLFLGTVPNGASVAKASIPGLDHAFIIPMSLSIKMLAFK